MFDTPVIRESVSKGTFQVSYLPLVLQAIYF